MTSKVIGLKLVRREGTRGLKKTILQFHMFLPELSSTHLLPEQEVNAHRIPKSVTPDSSGLHTEPKERQGGKLQPQASADNHLGKGEEG